MADNSPKGCSWPTVDMWGPEGFGHSLWDKKRLELRKAQQFGRQCPEQWEKLQTPKIEAIASPRPETTPITVARAHSALPPMTPAQSAPVTTSTTPPQPETQLPRQTRAMPQVPVQLASFRSNGSDIPTQTIAMNQPQSAVSKRLSEEQLRSIYNKQKRVHNEAQPTLDNPEALKLLFPIIAQDPNYKPQSTWRIDDIDAQYGSKAAFDSSFQLALMNEKSKPSRDEALQVWNTREEEAKRKFGKTLHELFKYQFVFRPDRFLSEIDITTIRHTERDLQGNPLSAFNRRRLESPSDPKPVPGCKETITELVQKNRTWFLQAEHAVASGRPLPNYEPSGCKPATTPPTDSSAPTQTVVKPLTPEEKRKYAEDIFNALHPESGDIRVYTLKQKLTDIIALDRQGHPTYAAVNEHYMRYAESRRPRVLGQGVKSLVDDIHSIGQNPAKAGVVRLSNDVLSPLLPKLRNLQAKVDGAETVVAKGGSGSAAKTPMTKEEEQKVNAAVKSIVDTWEKVESIPEVQLAKLQFKELSEVERNRILEFFRKSPNLLNGPDAGKKLKEWVASAVQGKEDITNSPFISMFLPDELIKPLIQVLHTEFQNLNEREVVEVAKKLTGKLHEQLRGWGGSKNAPPISKKVQEAADESVEKINALPDAQKQTLKLVLSGLLQFASTNSQAIKGYIENAASDSNHKFHNYAVSLKDIIVKHKLSEEELLQMMQHVASKIGISSSHGAPSATPPLARDKSVPKLTTQLTAEEMRQIVSTADKLLKDYNSLSPEDQQPYALGLAELLNFAGPEGQGFLIALEQATKDPNFIFHKFSQKMLSHLQDLNEGQVYQTVLSFVQRRQTTMTPTSSHRFPAASTGIPSGSQGTSTPGLPSSAQVPNIANQEALGQKVHAALKEQEEMISKETPIIRQNIQQLISLLENKPALTQKEASNLMQLKNDQNEYDRVINDWNTRIKPDLDEVIKGQKLYKPVEPALQNFYDTFDPIHKRYLRI